MSGFEPGPPVWKATGLSGLYSGTKWEKKMKKDEEEEKKKEEKQKKKKKKNNNNASRGTRNKYNLR